MSIPFSYFTTMAWEKFVEKYDAFMRNSKTTVKNEKTNTKLCFRTKWWFLKEFGSFLLSLYPLMSLTLFFLFFSTTAWFPSANTIWIGLSVHRRRGFTGLHSTAEGSISWCGAWSLAASLRRTFMDLFTTIMIIHVRDLSGHPWSLIAFTLSASVEGGCKRIGRIPGVMRSQS